MVAALDEAIQGQPTLAGLPGRFLFGIDDGRGDVSGLGADAGVQIIGDSAALLLAVYAVPNWLLFRSPVPLSGVAKTIGAPPFSNWGILFNYLLQVLPVLPSAAVVLALEWRHGRFAQGRFVYAGVALLGVSLGVHYFYYAAFSGWIPWPWYFYAYALMVALIAVVIILAVTFMGIATSEKFQQVGDAVAAT